MSGGLGDGDVVQDTGEYVGIKERGVIRRPSRRTQVKSFLKKMLKKMCCGSSSGTHLATYPPAN